MEQNVRMLSEYLKCILRGKPTQSLPHFENAELLELQEMLEYLALCLTENNCFLSDICQGNLDAPIPARHNFLAGSLKELHAVLRHLTWQTQQVAAGDYNQRVNFLGEFSVAFNQMVGQLREREVRLVAKSQALSRTTQLLMSILEVQMEWIVVVNPATQQIIYLNNSAKEQFYDPDIKRSVCNQHCPLLEEMLHTVRGDEGRFEYHCERSQKIISVGYHPIEWNDSDAVVYVLADITCQLEEIDTLQSLAYSDALTSLYNRHYCLEQLEALLEQGVPFSLALVDLDGLKQANDNFGHQAGDEYLQAVSALLRENSREADIVCRIGGDEFVILLPRCPKQRSEEKLAAIRASLQAEERPYRMSISYGVLALPEEQPLTVEEALQKADERMYCMKEKDKETRES